MSRTLEIEKKILREKIEAFLGDPNRGSVADVVLCLMSYREFYYRREDAKR